ncbi:MAG: thiamine pyrophosphate-dependent enzyme [Candidatus Kapabacteria bacterium]|nr:thiamine pyrophosphate-dependent enzyme [Candidatus Kapabacteria bacterium]
MAKAKDAKKSGTAQRTDLFNVSGFDKATLLDWYVTQHLGRRLDEKAANYLKMAKGWSYHAPFAGHDGIQLALGKIFRSGKDFLFPYYRDLLTSLAAGLTVEEIIANGLSKDVDVAGGGRHMSNHFAKISIGLQNSSSCTGNHSQQAAGTARSIKKFKGDEVVYCSTGDSTTSEGYYYEAVNGADREKLPLVFVIQNNKYGISVPLREQTANPVVAENFSGFTNLKIFLCDGRDPMDSYRTLEKARAYALSGKGPAMVHADCDRIGSHSNSDNHELYRTKEDIDAMKLRDPLPRMRATIIAAGIATDAELLALEEANKVAIFAAADAVEPLADPAPESYKEFLLPDAVVGYNDASESLWMPPAGAPLVTFREGILNAMKEEFRRNSSTFLFGQDVASEKKQGIFNVCKGMLDEFGNDRVFNAPIAEDFIVGTANGMTRYRDDIRVVVEGAEFADYFWPAMEQLIECTHDYWRTRGQFSPAVVIRLASGGYIQGGLYHSQNLEGTFTTLPGLRVVCPSFADDAVGLMRNSIRSRGTTMFLEPKFLYNYRPTSSAMPPEDFIIPFGKAKIRRPGTDVTVVTYGTPVHWSLQAAETLQAEGINVEVIDLRSLAPWDRELVFERVKRTGRCVVVHEDKKTGGFGGEIASAIGEELFRFLDAPVARLGSKDTPVGFAKSLESATLVNVGDVMEAIRKTMAF